MAIMCKMCGEECKDGEHYCINCGAELINVEQGLSECKSYLSLVELRTKKSICIKEEGLIGRIGNIEQEYFAADKHVSEEHCEVYRCGSQWMVEHVGNTNKTVINGTILQNNVPMVIRNGDRLRIADLLFKVSIIEECIEGEMISRTKVNAKRWCIVCPICGKQYWGDDSDFSVKECVGSCSKDEFDRYEIASVRPYMIGE